MFRPVDSRASFPEMEKRILQLWRERDVFRKSIESRPEEKLYVFYEGPPTANARPGVHHVLSRAFKDLFPRYKTMRGYRVPRKAGWDTHGLPVELEVERELGLKSKAEIEEFGVEEFNRRCRESVFRYVQEWEALTERIGFWLDMEHPYITYDNDYIESVWWIVKQLWDKGLLYLDYRSTPHCPRCGTSLSDGEVALGYREDTPDPSVYVKFRLTQESRRHLGLSDEGPTYMLAWTTTPWTLPGNTALAVQRYAEYVIVENPENHSETFILARSRVDAYLDTMLGAAGIMKGLAAEFRQHSDVVEEGSKALQELVVATLSGEDLLGLRYEPLYDPTAWGVPAMWFDPAQGGRLITVEKGQAVEAAYTVIAGEFVSLSDGTGVVHIAPAFGGEDFDAGKELGLLFLQPVDLRGQMIGGPWAGTFVKDADGPIMDDLAQRGLLLRRDVIRHTYPFCWRCDTPLLYYAKPTWYIRTTAVKDSLIEGNERINWYPGHIRHGRFGDWLNNNVDWALSRERYWGTPLPVWRCDTCGAHACVGSREEMRSRALDPAAVDALEDLHRPYVDRIELRCDCGATMRRALEVMDCWLDSGAMPYAQWHYPFENRDTFGRGFPADFICEAVDQTRGWFYTLHAEAVLLHAAGAAPENLCYRNVICLGHIQDDKGRKMSKSLGNVVEPMEVLDRHGADALRWYLYTATRPGEARRFSADLVAESLRRFLLTLWNTYSFFVTYANIDRFDPSTGSGQVPTTAAKGEPSELDRWLLSELHTLVRRVTEQLEEYDPTGAGRAIQSFVEDLSNWYVRRSRRRFWKTENDADKLAAYHTLYGCLVTLCKLMAPFTPFVAEEMYQNLVRSADSEAPESVHLAEWPEADASQVDQRLMEDMQLVMRVASLGRAARSKAGIKVRQPLSRVSAFVATTAQAEGLRRQAGQVLEELNVKELQVFALIEAFKGPFERPKDLLAMLTPDDVLVEDDAGYAVAVNASVTPELAEEGLARELVHRIQNLRKAAGFDISDHITTYLAGPEWLSRVLGRHGDYVRQETLSEELVEGAPPDGAHAEEQKLESEPLKLAVQRV
ncbi:MAG: isoleucine--tRNA ligase [Dehalococcoidia bacterium]|nr:isoleucine--tRNA ligase [Dehalococcoidia bacterium]